MDKTEFINSLLNNQKMLLDSYLNQAVELKETKAENKELKNEILVLKEQLEECKAKNLCASDGVAVSKEIKDFKVKFECEVDHDRLRAALHDAAKMIDKAINDSVTVTLL